MPSPTSHLPSPGGGAAELPIHIYSPEPMLGHPAKLVAAMARDIWAGRELAWRLFVRDMSAQYRQTFLGYIWAFLPPLVASFTFIFLQSQGITNISGTSIPYPAFAMMGTLLWQVFVDAIMSPASSLVAAKPMLSKINFPREAILVAGLYMVLFNFLVRLVLVIGVLIWWKIPVSATVLFFPVAMGSLLLAGFAIGLAILPIAGLYGDATRAVPIVAQFWMLLTPVVYPPHTEGLAGWLAVWNPVSPLIVTARETLTAAPLSLLPAFWIITATRHSPQHRAAMPATRHPPLSDFQPFRF